MRRRLAFALVALLAGPACSWVTMGRPPPPPVEPLPPVACTTSRAAPILDTTGATFFGGLGIMTAAYGIATPVCTTGWCIGPETGGAKAGIIAAGLGLTAIAVLQTISATNGFAWASTCDDLKAAQLSCVSGVEEACVVIRRPPPRVGKSPGETCEAADECKDGFTCYLGRCQVAR
jgi:hypothetical protein